LSKSKENNSSGKLHREGSSGHRVKISSALDSSNKEHNLRRRSSHNDMEKLKKIKMEESNCITDRIKKHSWLPSKQRSLIKERHYRDSYVSNSSDEEDNIPIANIIYLCLEFQKFIKYSLITTTIIIIINY